MNTQVGIQSSEQQTILGIARELAQVFGRNAARLDREGTFDIRHYELAHSAGYMKLTLPRRYGGYEADPLVLCLAQEELAKGCSGTALAICMHLCLQADLSHMLSTPQRDRILGEAAERPVTFAGGGTEAESGGNWDALPPSAMRSGEGFILQGRKRFVSGAQAADYFYSFLGMRRERASGPLVTDVSGFLIPRNTRGVAVEQTWDSMGMRASGSDDLVLNGVELGPSALVGREGRGFLEAARWTFYFLFAETGTYVGVAKAALDEARDYLKARRQRNAGPRYDQLLMLGEMVARFEGARAFLHQEAQVFSDPEVRRRGFTRQSLARAAMAKYVATSTSIWVVDRAMDLLGGFGLLKEGPMERHYRDVRSGPFHPPRNSSTALALAGHYLLGPNLGPSIPKPNLL